jgi:plastocyanin
MTSSEGIVSRASIWRAALAGGAMLALFAVPVALPAASSVSSTPPQQLAKAEGLQVTIQNFQFAPAALTVPAGTTVTWTNRDDDTHTVTEANKRFASKVLDPGQSFSYTFSAPGTYSYHCAIHPHMTATVIVK